MKKIQHLLLLIILFMSACEKVDLNAPYMEIPVVYCILNQKDTVQYVRINRMYQCENGYDYMQNVDSITYAFGAWEVCLEQWRNGEMIADPIVFEPSTAIAKDNGPFTTGNHVLYKTEQGLLANCDYLLKCRKKDSGLELKAECSSLGKYNYISVSEDSRTYYSPGYFQEIIDYHGSLFHPNYDRKIMRFLYLEYRNNVTYHKYVDLFPRENPLFIAPLKDDSLDAQFPAEYFRYLSECIPVDPEVRREAIGVDHMFTIANEELFRYISLYNDINAYFYVPDFTNFENAKGIFSCRYHYTYFGKLLKGETIDTISYGKYLKNHRFADSQGNWH